MTTGEGGAIVTNSKEIYEKVKLIRSHGRLDNKNYFSNPSESQYDGLGYNWRMSSITAALGISQLKKLDKIAFVRFASVYREFQDIGEFQAQLDDLKEW